MVVDVPEGPIILNMGSCGLHVIHGAFKTGHSVSKWNVNQILTAAYYAFTDSPARRSAYTNMTCSSIFPLTFCRTRWVEYSKVGTRFLEQFVHVKTFIEKYRNSNPSNSLKILKTSIEDPFLIAKVTFFVSLASELEPFLVRFQSSKPLSPFLFEACESLLRNLLSRILKPNVIEEQSETYLTIAELMLIDLDDTEFLSVAKKIKVGFATEKELETLLKSRISKKNIRARNLSVS